MKSLIALQNKLSLSGVQRIEILDSSELTAAKFPFKAIKTTTKHKNLLQIYITGRL